jgi:hypothetical protein
MIDLGLYTFYALLLIAIIAAVVFPILHSIKEPSALLKSAIGLGVVIVVFGISYALADSSVNLKAAALGVTESSSKMIGAGLIMFYIALVASLAALLYSEISKALK